MAEEFIIRLAEQRDMKNVFELSNDDLVRHNSIHQEKIEWDSHVKWFANAIQNESIKFYIAETLGGDFIGQVRFSFDDGEWISSLSLNRKYRGKGLAPRILVGAIEKSQLAQTKAFIKLENIASIKTFQKAEYKEVGCEEIMGEIYKVLIYAK